MSNADRLETLLNDVREQLTETTPSSDRLQSLLEATLVVGFDLELDSILQRLVAAAAGLTGARYGALGVRARSGGLKEFVHVGIDEKTRKAVGALPQGHGLLGLLIEHPDPVRLSKIGDHPASVGFPKNHPPMDSFLGIPIIVRDKVFGSIYLTEKYPASDFTKEDEIILQVLATAAGIAIDNARLFAESQNREKWISVISHINSRLLAGASVPETLSLLVHNVRELTSSANVFILTSTNNQVHVTATTHPDLAEAEVPVTGTALEKILSGSGTISTIAMHQLPKSLRAGPQSHALALPLSRTSGVFGILLVVDIHDENWPQEDWSRLDAVAYIASLALEFADQQYKRRQLDVLADRDRIARDLHDHVIQRLFATGMTLQSALKNLEEHGNSTQPRDQISRAVTQLDSTVREIRTAIFDLHTTDNFQSQALRRRMLDIVAELTENSKIVPSVKFSGAVDTHTPPELYPHAEAVLREGLSNALRHSQATSVSLSISATTDLTITICDDGRGIPENISHSGLANLELRARQHRGSFTTEHNLTGGTTLTWTVPL
ncbi:MAG: GAF domain-containing protein [Mycobacteriaceae bacterium]